MISQQESTRTSYASTGEAGMPATAISPIQIWLVDDDDRLRSIITEWLQRFEGIQCTREFNSPNGVLSALASKPGPDVILLDVQMGEHSGLDAVRPIRSLSRSTRVVMFTSNYDGERRKRALDDGASDFLLKFNPLEEVVARIRELAREPAPVVRRRGVPASGCAGGHGGIERRRSWFQSTRADSAHSEPDASQRHRSLSRYLDLFRARRG